MAIYHANIKAFSRGKNHSSVAAAAYRAGIDLVDTGSRVIHRYSQRKGVISYHMLAPAGSPAWCSDARVFWDANEAWESRANARVAREVETSLPSELTSEQRERLALALGQAFVDRFGVVVLVAIHGPGKHSDARNHHVHLLLSARKVGPEGLGARACVELDAREGVGHKAMREVRGIVADIINQHLEAAGLEERVDHRRLTVQAEEAAEEGDFAKAVELTREPMRRVDLDTFLARKAAVASKEAGATPIDQAIERARQECRLMTTPQGQQAAAQKDAQRDKQAKNARGSRRGGAASVRHPVLRHMAIGRSTGAAAEVLNSQADVIEDWLASQLSASRSALDSVRELEGFRPEDSMMHAMLALDCRRFESQRRAGFRDAVDCVVQSMQIYASAMLKPEQDRETVRRTLAQIAVAEDEVRLLGKSARHLRRAREDYQRAREAMMGNALGQDQRVINDARAILFRDIMKLERLYPLSTAATRALDDSTMLADSPPELPTDQPIVKPVVRPRFNLRNTL